jgi:tRNA threonylcarbamoyladenosine biosynthesis protein TsaB
LCELGVFVVKSALNENWLILETSGRVARVGLARANAIAQLAELDSGRKQARELVPTINAMLKAESLRPTDLTGVMVGRGPGSYTGLRVGLATAKALAYATGCELRAVDTFAAIAEQAPKEANSVWVIADALQNQVYVQRFNRTPTGWKPFQELRIGAVDEWLNWLSAGAWVSGPGVAVYENKVPLDCPRVPQPNREARIESVFAVGLRLPPLTREELFALEPLYLRGSSAEEKAKAKSPE